MKDDYTKEERELLKAKNPKDYIDKSLKSKISSGRKAFLTKMWLENSGYTADDIKYHRNRHPYWKAKKMEGTAERNAVRVEEHDYSKGKEVDWNDQLIKKFIDMNKKDKNGMYIHKDWKLAKEFKCTIPVVQHMRRKFNLTIKILGKNQDKPSSKKVFELMKMGENTLRRINKKK